MVDVPIEAPWTVTDYLLAAILDELREANDSKRIGVPKRAPVKRPEQTETNVLGGPGVPISHMNEILDWQGMAQHLGVCKDGCA